MISALNLAAVGCCATRRVWSVVLVAFVAVFAQTAALRADEDVLRDKIRPFLREHCYACHEGRRPEGKISLSQFRDEKAVAAKPEVWFKVQSVLKSGKMPPKDEERPKAEDVKFVVDWIERDVLKIDCGAPRDPGRVTIRRLNRTEYRNTIRDLVGIDFRATEDFPLDDVGYGFDNIGDVLSTSPLLFEKYLAAAEKITAEAIAADDPRFSSPRKRYEAESLGPADGGAAAFGGFLFASNGKLTAKHPVEKAGRYVLRFQAFGQQAGDEPTKLAVSVDDKELQVIEVKAEQSEPATYEVETTLAAGERKITFGFVNDFYQPELKPRGDRNLFVDYVEIQGPLADAKGALPETHRKIIFETPRDKGRTTRRSARAVLEKFASRAYRRPVKDDELVRLVKIVRRAEDDGESFESGIQLAIQAVLISPHFLFRIEHDEFPDDPTRSHLINEYELATRLSYFIWSTMPDEELTREAAAGTLRKNLMTQVRRMMADAKSQSLLVNFSGQWLETRKLASSTPDSKLFPTYNAALREAMRQETEMFFAAVVREDLPLTTLLDGKFTFLNEALAAHYGVDGVKGQEMRRVELKDDRRGGILTQASVLTVTSNPTRTSPVKRGKWIMEQILGTPPPPPPPNVPELKEGDAAEATGSLRQRMEAHRSNAVCASCHVSMDALGFAFENYDAVGRWRDMDGKFPIDPSGETPSHKAFKNPAELKRSLSSEDRDLFVRCLAEKVLTYALGRGVEYYDKCTLEDLASATAKGDYKFSALLQAIVVSDAFQKRRAKRAER